MFFRICSNQKWEKNLYNIVWYIEINITSLLLEYTIKEIKNLKKNKLYKDLLFLLEYGPKTIGGLNTKKFAEEFIEREYESIENFCNKFIINSARKSKEQLLCPKKVAVLKALKESNKFLKFNNLLIKKYRIKSESIGLDS